MQASGSCRRARPIRSRLLKVGTTTNLSPDEVHQTGLEQVGELYATQMDVLLREQGLTQGTVAERLTALTRIPVRSSPTPTLAEPN